MPPLHILGLPNYTNMWRDYGYTDADFANGGSDRLIGFTFLAYGVPFALLATRGGALASKRGAMAVAVVGTLLVTPITVGYGFMKLPILILIFSAFEGMIQAMAVPASQAVVASGAPVGRAAAAQGLAGASNLLVAATTAYAAGGLYGAVGPEWMFSIAGVVMVVVVGLAVLSYRQAERPAEPIS